MREDRHVLPHAVFASVACSCPRSDGFDSFAVRPRSGVITLLHNDPCCTFRRGRPVQSEAVVSDLPINPRHNREPRHGEKHRRGQGAGARNLKFCVLRAFDVDKRGVARTFDQVAAA